MPTYEYQCLKCGLRFEKAQKMSDDPLKHCPECGGEVRRLIGSGAGIILKGPGFHVNDYGTGSSNPGEGSCCGMTNPCSDPKKCCEK